MALTSEGVPLVSHTACGTVSMAAISRAFFNWSCFNRLSTCCTAPLGGSGIRKRVLAGSVFDCPCAAANEISNSAAPGANLRRGWCQ